MSDFDMGATLAELLGQTGDVQLASLTREELLSVGDDPMLAHSDDARWWEELDETGRMLVIETAQRSMLARRLLLGDEHDDLVAVDEVKAILVARRAPAWLGVLSEAREDAAEPGDQVVLAGLPDHEAVLISVRIEGVFVHRLATRPIALAAGADWLLTPPDDPARAAGRTIEILSPGPATEQRARAIVMGRGEDWFLSEVVDGQPGDPAPATSASLADWLDQHTADGTPLTTAPESPR